jgi:cell fate regulator YaaT (PSP1 superfamily)
MADNPPRIVGVRFSRVGKVYHFDASGVDGIKIDDSVIVETSRGLQLGQVALIVVKPSAPPDGSWKRVDRLATARDLMLRQSWQKLEPEVVAAGRQRARELALEGIKVIAAEYAFDGSRLTVLFSSETDEKMEIKSLKQDLQRQFGPAQVELKQIGPRDVAKFFGGMGACGLENRCCTRFLTEFSSISIKMAKEQGISLTPTEITGMCGRLRCCLIYEYELYVAARQLLPKRNKRVITPQGEGRVVDVIPLRDMVLVELPELGVRQFARLECQPAEELEALQKKAQNPDCDNCGSAKPNQPQK